MNKTEFIRELSERLSALPAQEANDRLTFYSEMIDDRIEEGLTEEEAVRLTGGIDEIMAQSIEDIPLTRLVKERIKPKRKIKAWETVLIVLGSPLWLSLLAAVLAVALSLYIVLWAAVICLWAAVAALGACAFSGVAGGIGFVCLGKAVPGLALAGAGLVCAGLTVLMCFAGCAAAKGAAVLTKKILLWLKGCFVRKEEA